VRTLQAVLGTLLTGLGALLAITFYDRYWRWRDCFNEFGRCFDPISQDVYLEQSGGVYGSLAALFLGLGLGLLIKALRRRHQSSE